jgi:hypothetical protein
MNRKGAEAQRMWWGVCFGVNIDPNQAFEMLQKPSSCTTKNALQGPSQGSPPRRAHHKVVTPPPMRGPSYNVSPMAIAGRSACDGRGRYSSICIQNAPSPKMINGTQ